MPRPYVLAKCCILILTCYVFMANGEMMINTNDAHRTTGGVHGRDRNAFFALRSCHQLLHGDHGEFFSPDYLCSNPALWCNWTIQVDPGKRVHLYLEDFTVADTCHLKTDQIHLDESPGATGVHRILEKCWRQAKYTSLSNTLHVVLLIGGSPSPPHRGFYGHYQAIGPPATPKTPAAEHSGVEENEVVSREERDGDEMETGEAVTEVPLGVKGTAADFTLPQENNLTEERAASQPPIPQAQTKPATPGRLPPPTSTSNELPAATGVPRASEDSRELAPEEEADEAWNHIGGRTEEVEVAVNTSAERTPVETMGNHSDVETELDRLDADAPFAVFVSMATGRPGRRAAQTQTPLSPERADISLTTTPPAATTHTSAVHTPPTQEPRPPPEHSPRTAATMRRNADARSREVTTSSTTTERHGEPVADATGDRTTPETGVGSMGTAAQVGVSASEPSVAEGTYVSSVAAGDPRTDDLRAADPLQNAMKEPKADSRTKERVVSPQTARNHTKPHLPGDLCSIQNQPRAPSPSMFADVKRMDGCRQYGDRSSNTLLLPIQSFQICKHRRDLLFEVSVEVDFHHSQGQSWDHLMTSFLSSVQSRIEEDLGVHAPTISVKRIKKLSEGVLFILWVQFGQGQEGTVVHKALHTAVQGLQGKTLSVGGHRTQGLVTSVSITDINECGTQMVVCHLHADCVNRFGSYACRCRSGYMDKSRLGPGGTVCVDPAMSGCSWTPSPMLLQGVYGVCFLLSLLLMLLLFVVGVLYRRHHRGAFLLRCQNRSNASGTATVANDDDNNNNTCSGCLHTSPGCPPQPPPPPQRRPRDGWTHPKDACPSVDLPLLRFSTPAPPGGSGGKVQEERDEL